MTKKVHPVIIAALLLGMFAVIGSTLVSFTHQQTLDRIAENQRQALLKQLYTLIPAEQIDNDIVTDTISVSAPLQLGAAQTLVYRARQSGEPRAAVFTTVAPDGYSGKIALLVAVNIDGSLAGVRVVSHRETPGLGDKIEAERNDWILGFSGLSLQNPPASQWKVKRDGGYFDQFTGATITPRAVVRAVASTLAYFQSHRESLFKRDAKP